MKPQYQYIVLHVVLIFCVIMYKIKYCNTYYQYVHTKKMHFIIHNTIFIVVALYVIGGSRNR